MKRYSINDVLKRIEKLEQKYGNNLPDVIAEYADGTQITYKGTPLLDHLTRADNPIIKTFGSKFADLLDIIIHPVPNRNIEDYE